MKKLQIPQKERQVIDEFNKELKNILGKNLISAHIFGSYARGDWKKNSDIDILVVIKDKNSSMEEKIYKVVNDLLLKSDIYLSVKIFDQKEFQKLNKIPSIFMQSIRNEMVKV